MIAGSWARHLAAARIVRRVLELRSRLRRPTVEELRSWLEDFVRWWAAELWACLPSRWQDRLRHRNLHFFIRFSDDEKRVHVVERNNARPGCAFALTPQNEQEAACRAEIQRAVRKGGARLELVVPEAVVARRTMKVPLAAKDNLRETLRSELEQVARVEHTDVYFDHSISDIDQEAKTITLNAAIVQRTFVDEKAAALRDAGLNLSAARAWQDGKNSPDATFFSAPTQRSAQAVRMTTVALVLLVVALDIAAAYVPLWVKIDELSDLQSRIEAIKPELQDAFGQERTLSELRNRDAYLVGLKTQTPSVSEVLGEIARVLPDTAWLEQLQVREGRVQLEGLSAASAELIATLQQSGMLSDIRFDWPVTPDATPNVDRFDISARVEHPGKNRE